MYICCASSGLWKHYRRIKSSISVQYECSRSVNTTSVTCPCSIEFMLLNVGNTECTCKSVLISTVCLGVALVICLIGLVTVIILLIKSKTKVGTVVVNTAVDKGQLRNTPSSSIGTKKNISYAVHSPRLNQL